jgi:hypothetical protein
MLCQPLIFITTAITRNDLHKKSIGNLYDQVGFELLDTFQVSHIINIDFPPKLRNNKIFSVKQTKELFENIIPHNVQKTFLISENVNTNQPTFANAFANVVEEASDKINSIVDNTYANSIVWWMEDDWEPIQTYNYVPLCKSLLKTTNSVAITLTNSAPLCSFRGGPIMNASFFNTYFNISQKIKSKGDPEYWVGKSIRTNASEPVYQSNIYIANICILSEIENANGDQLYNDRVHSYYYSKKFKETKFAPNCGIRYISAFIKTPQSQEIYFTDIFEDANSVQQTSRPTNLNNARVFHKGTIDEFHKVLTPCQLTHITVTPHVFKDIGRKFNRANNVISFAHNT